MEDILQPPVLKLALENVSQLDEIGLEGLWSAFRKVSGLLEVRL